MPVMSTATDFGALEASLIPVNDTHQHDEIPADLLLHDIDDDTYQHGKHKTSVAGATFSYVCTTVGAGVLSLPGALAYGGWCGLFIILFTSILCNVTGKYLAGCMFAIPGKPLRTYEDIGVAAIGPIGRPLVAFFQCITLFGVCTIFLILIGGNMHTLVSDVTLHVWVFIFGFCLIPVSWIKTMAEISYLAYFGVGTSLFVAVVVVIKGCIAGSHHEMTGGIPVSHDIITDFNGFSLAFNIIVFSFGGHSVLPAIVNEMSDARHNYHRLCNYAFGTIAAIYTCVTAAGYWGYGSETKDNVLKNMDASSGIVKCAYAMITAHVLLAYPIPLNPVSLYMEEVLGIDKIINNWKKEWITRILLRSTLVLGTIFLASVVPYFGDILSIVSALSVIAVAFVLPPLFYYRLYRHTLTRTHIIFLWFVITFGILSSVVGLYYSIKGLSDDIKKGGNPFDHFFTN